MALGFHILAGGLALVSGYIALYAAKGAPLHRKAGNVFVAVVLAMTLSGVLLAAVRGAAPELNIPAALIAAYLVVTGLGTVKPAVFGARWLSIVALVVAFAVGISMLNLAFEAVALGGTRKGMPAFPFFLFAAIGVLGSIGDVRALRSGPPTGTRRLARHLWRMCTALLIAAMSFFIGQADEIPKPFRIMPLLALPILAALVTMLYWLWRLRVRRSLRGIAGGVAPGAA